MHCPTPSKPSSSKVHSSDAFSVLMTSHKENEAWKEASEAEDRTFRASKGNRRKAPFYKVLQGMPIAVDAFRYGSIPGVTAYFLTHAHSDHYTNLAANWKNGPIYCSDGTANLIIHMLSVDPKWVHPLPMDVPTIIPNTGGVKVTLIEANHCPGSCLFFYEGPQTIDAGDSAFKSPFVGSSQTFRYLHCGDFRASPRHVLHPAVKGKRIDHIYLDTTYLDPKYTFPPQPLVISACAELARRIVAKQSTSDGAGERKLTMDSFMTVDKSPVRTKQDKTLIVVGTYSIGKERIVKAIAKALNTRVYCDARKAAILRCQSDPELHALLTTDPYAALVHLVPLGLIAADKLKTYIERFNGTFTRVVGFRPTGWTYTAPSGSEQSPSIPSIIARTAAHPPFTYSSFKPMRNSTAALTLYGVPYSEHSSFFELTCFAMSLEWTKMIATVNVGSAVSRGKMGRWVERWEAERKKRGKTEIVKYRELDYW
ncbi:DRMBL-domain-containing protein [Athelia psychrophila]|uniref:DRMBL-domain-containing protein n=1 Tax=Athelia psychrophila TaxID=1759441 RepID=A0A166JPR8_9AGAM|nr:DRMBL-domain-containing protein [Fibularhizoctonia sp. CBS 109695]